MKTDDDLRANPPPPPPARRDPLAAPQVNFPTIDPRITLALILALVVWAGYAGGWPLLLVIGAIVVMITLHELGHYLAAKASGMKVTEFFLGFGPRLWSFRRGETEYGLKAIPAGAYVRIIGMHNLEEVDPADEPRTYRQATFPRRLAVATAGSAMHFLQALVAIFLVLTVFGAPGGHIFTGKDPGYSIDQTEPGSPAQLAGIQHGDRFLTLNGQDVSTLDKLHRALDDEANKDVSVVVERNGQDVTIPVHLAERAGRGYFGVTLAEDAQAKQKVGLATATGRTFQEFGAVSKDTLGFFGAFFSPSGLSNFANDVLHPGDPTVHDSGSQSTAPASGSSSAGSSSSQDTNRPISIIGAAGLGAEITRRGAYAFLAFFASINIVIGVFNLIPLLPLDGGHVAVAVYERIRSRKGHPYHADVMKLMPIAYAVFAVLVVIGVSTMYLDIVSPLHLPG